MDDGITLRERIEMANVINRTTGEIRRSVHTPDYDPADWAINPQGFDVAESIPAHYRVIEGGTVREATADEKVVIDVARLPQIKAQQIIDYCDRIESMLQASAAKSAGELSMDADAVGTEFKRVVGLVKAAKDAAEVRDIATTLEAT